MKHCIHLPVRAFRVASVASIATKACPMPQGFGLAGAVVDVNVNANVVDAKTS